MKQIIIVKPNSISKEDKTLLKAENILVIEHPTPDLVRIVTPLDGLNSNELIKVIASAGLNTSNDHVRLETGKAILRQLTKGE